MNGSHTLFSAPCIRGKARTHILIPPSSPCWCGRPYGRRRIDVVRRGLVVLMRVGTLTRMGVLGMVVRWLRGVGGSGWWGKVVRRRVESLWRVGLLDGVCRLAWRHWRKLRTVTGAILIVVGCFFCCFRTFKAVSSLLNAHLPLQTYALWPQLRPL